MHTYETEDTYTNIGDPTTDLDAIPFEEETDGYTKGQIMTQRRRLIKDALKFGL